MSIEPIKRNLARNAAAAVHSALDDYHNEFKAITRRTCVSASSVENGHSGKVTPLRTLVCAKRWCSAWWPVCA